MVRQLVRVAAALTIVALLSAHVAHAQSGGVQYVYDESGRLVAVIDATGNAAVYSYDAVGNLLSIARHGPAEVSLFEVVPDSGPTGTTVTLYGTGFDPTPGQNTVLFNGTAATVTSAAANTLVVTVPAGATTGPVSVTSPLGSATSPTAFTIISSGPPVITGFTPTAGSAGTSVDRWFDPKGGEWRWHAPDRHHPNGHWDYNPWDRWNSPWQNVPASPNR